MIFETSFVSHKNYAVEIIALPRYGGNNNAEFVSIVMKCGDSEVSDISASLYETSSASVFTIEKCFE